MLLCHMRSTMAETAKKMVSIPARGVDYRGKVVLAPMVRSGELPSRLLALHYGADLVWGPETVDHSMIGTSKRTNPTSNMLEWTRIPSNSLKTNRHTESVIFRIDPARESSRLVFQLGTSDPARAVKVAELVLPHVAGIDVNAGCPKPFSISGGMGAALLRNPDRLVAILEALVVAVQRRPDGVGVSVKIRLLETAAETEALVRRLVATGITGLTVHCRTTPMRPRERAIRGQLRMVAQVCREAGVACLMNGDVEDRDQAESLMAEYGVDGAMIATAAEKNPSCFRSKRDGGLAPWNETVEKYLRFAMEVGNKFGNSKYLLGQMIPGKEAAYRVVSQAKSHVQLCKVLEYPQLADMAAEADARSGKTMAQQPSKKRKRGQGEESSVANRKLSERTEDEKASGGNDSPAAVPAEALRGKAVVVEVPVADAAPRLPATATV